MKSLSHCQWVFGNFSGGMATAAESYPMTDLALVRKDTIPEGCQAGPIAPEYRLNIA